jgi:predicted DCC family thiol-disulfide oxidoreductase YuxK
MARTRPQATGSGAANPVPIRVRLAEFQAYSWRRDSAVPPFVDHDAMIVFDGVCILCSGFARFIVRRDRSQHFRLVSAQSDLGQILLRHYNLDLVEFETNLLIENGRADAKLEAVAGILARLGPFWYMAARAIRMLPERGGDWLYDRIATNRYALFGRSDTCIVPGPEWRDRVLDVENRQGR